MEVTKKNAIEELGTKGIVPVDYIFKDLEDYVNNTMEVSSEGIKIKEAANDFRKSILKANQELKRTDLTAAEINRYKARFGKDLDTFYDKVATITESMPVRKEIKAVVQNTMKTHLENIVPDLKIMRFSKISRKIINKEYPELKNKEISLKQLNEIEGNLIELRKVINDETRKMKVGEFLNFQVGQKASTLGRFGAVIGAASAKIFEGDPLVGGGVGFGIGTVGGTVLGMIDSSSRIKMSVGNVLDSLRAIGILVKPNATLIRLGLYKSADYLEHASE
jgi:hypothetical protein